MHALKALRIAAAATVLAAIGVPAIAAVSEDSSPAPATKWWMRIVPTQQRVTTDVIEQIQPGMDERVVKSLIGAPDTTGHFPLSNTTSWDYRYRDAWGYNATFSAIFSEDHVVVSKASIRRAY